MIRAVTDGGTAQLESLRIRTMLQDGIQKAAAGITSMDEVLRAVSVSGTETS